MTARLTMLHSELAVGIHLDVFIDGIGPWAGTVAGIVDNGATASVTVDLDPIRDEDGNLHPAAEPVVVDVPVGDPPAPGQALTTNVLGEGE